MSTPKSNFLIFFQGTLFDCQRTMWFLPFYKRHFSTSPLERFSFHPLLFSIATSLKILRLFSGELCFLMTSCCTLAMTAKTTVVTNKNSSNLFMLFLLDLVQKSYLLFSQAIISAFFQRTAGNSFGKFLSCL